MAHQKKKLFMEKPSEVILKKKGEEKSDRFSIFVLYDVSVAVLCQSGGGLT